jgi:hypothetical protein
VAKIIVSLDDQVLREVTISSERITIGRRAYNDIVIDDIAVSGEHAAIVTRHNDSMLEDLDSLNGTQVNGQPVNQHFLRNGDVIELSRYRIRYVAEVRNAAARHDDAGVERRSVWGGPQYAARIRVLNGANAGREIGLTKALTTIGRPGKQVALVTQLRQGYGITHVEGDTRLLINGLPVTGVEHPLVSGDVIDLAGTQTKFLQG